MAITLQRLTSFRWWIAARTADLLNMTYKNELKSKEGDEVWTAIRWRSDHVMKMWSNWRREGKQKDLHKRPTMRTTLGSAWALLRFLCLLFRVRPRLVHIPGYKNVALLEHWFIVEWGGDQIDISHDITLMLSERNHSTWWKYVLCKKNWLNVAIIPIETSNVEERDILYLHSGVDIGLGPTMTGGNLDCWHGEAEMLEPRMRWLNHWLTCPTLNTKHLDWAGIRIGR